MFVNSDFSDLLRIFNDNNVKYLVIGGYAVVQYAEPRFTKDLDLMISTDARNAQAVYNALKQFGAPLAGLTPKDFSEEGFFFQRGVPLVSRLDARKSSQRGTRSLAERRVDRSPCSHNLVQKSQRFARFC